MADLTVALNNDTIDSEFGTSGVNWTEMAVGDGNDFLVWTKGDDVVKDGEPVPSQSELIQAGVILTGLEQVVPKYLLADISSDLLREIFNMGNQNKRYVMAFSFDGATASEPTLELWDDVNLDSTDETTLGAGVPSSSWWRGITTTDALPGADWALSGGFTRLAGASDGHFLWLNDQNGALPGADILYCNLAIVVPASAIQGGSAAPIWAVKFNSN